jgi:UDP-glucose 4-epimerase
VPRVALVTGAAGQFGSRLARSLAADPRVVRVIAVDLRTPEADLGGADFIRVDIRSPILARVISDAAVDTVVHAGVLATSALAGNRAAMKEINVIGSMQLLAACQASDTVRRLVVKSSASVYGCGPADPAMFTETDQPENPPTGGWARDCAEVEGYVAAFARRRSDVDIVTRRFANAIGPTIDTAMTRYFRLPILPIVLGRDPRLQFVHESDVLTALHTAATGSFTGTFNVAGPGVVTLLQAAGLAHRPVLTVPEFLLGPAHGLLRRAGVDFSVQDIDFLAYGRVLDTGAAKRSWGFVPQYSTREAFESSVSGADRVANYEVDDEAGIGHG